MTGVRAMDEPRDRPPIGEVFARDAEIVARREKDSQFIAQLRMQRLTVGGEVDLVRYLVCIMDVAILDRDFTRRRESGPGRIRGRDERDGMIDDRGLTMDERMWA